MKTALILLTFTIAESLMAASVGMNFNSLGTDFYCAFGTISCINPAGTNQYNILVSDLEEIPNPASAQHVNNNETRLAQSAHSSITLDLSDGIDGIVVMPQKEWLGRRVLFVVQSGSCSVPPIGVDISPDGNPFYVFDESEHARPAALLRAAQVLTMTNDFMRAEQMSLAIESFDEDEFVKRMFCIKLLELTKKNRDSDLEDSLKKKLANWRDNPKFDKEFRVYLTNLLKGTPVIPYVKISSRVNANELNIQINLKDKDGATKSIINSTPPSKPRSPENSQK